MDWKKKLKWWEANNENVFCIWMNMGIYFQTFLFSYLKKSITIIFGLHWLYSGILLNFNLHIQLIFMFQHTQTNTFILFPTNFWVILHYFFQAYTWGSGGSTSTCWYANQYTKLKMRNSGGEIHMDHASEKHEKYFYLHTAFALTLHLIITYVVTYGMHPRVNHWVNLKEEITQLFTGFHNRKDLDLITPI